MGRRRSSDHAPSAARAAVLDGRARRILLPLAVAGAGAAAIFGANLIRNASAAGGSLHGAVFEDHNANGSRDVAAALANLSGSGSIAAAVDRGVQAVSVRVYSAAGNLIGSSATEADGSFSMFGLPASGIVRVEFDDLPAGYAAGPTGPDSRTSVQFVDLAGADPSAYLGVLRADRYCQDNPLVAVSCPSYGDAVAGPNASAAALVAVPYRAGSSASSENAGTSVPTTPTVTVANSAIGPTWGLAYDRAARRVFAAAHFRRHSGFGPGGPGAIYAIDVPSGQVSDTFFVAGASVDAHDANLETDGFDAGYAAVGTTSLGGLAITEDGSRMYAMNLANRTLYALDPSTGAELAHHQVPLAPPGCAAPGDVRPFAVTIEGGAVYVGLTCTAQSTGSAAQLRAYVYRADAVSLAFTAAPVFEASLAYPRGLAQQGGDAPTATWHPWTTGWPNVGAGGSRSHAQPLLTQIQFVDGDLVLGIADRFGDQTGNNLPADPGEPAQRFTGVAAGDVLRACRSGSTWELEDAGRCGTSGIGPQGTGQGPGGAELYFVDGLDGVRDETSSGAVAAIPGSSALVLTASAPTPLGGGVGDSLRVLDASSGSFRKGYRVRPTPGAADRATPGLGGIALLCDSAPIEVGNRVWRDTFGNGIQDAAEPGIEGVTVQLWSTGASAARVGTAVTDADGTYRFSSTVNEPADGDGDAVGGGIEPNRKYEIRVPVAGPNAAVLDGTHLTVADAATGAGSDLRDSDAVAAGTYARIAFSTAGAGQNDHALDVGMTSSVSVGDLVWNDSNNDGLLSVGEPGLGDVAVRLLTAAGQQVATTRTDGAGHYSFVGLAPGDYLVEVTPPAGFRSSTGKNGNARGPFEPGANPNDDRDADDNGTSLGAAVRSAPVRVTPGNEPTNDGDTDADTNRAVDFGLFRAAAIGDTVWFDNDSNGVQDAGEPGVPRVTATVYDASGSAVASTISNGSGRYRLDDLLPGTYSVGFSDLPAGYRLTDTGKGGAMSDSDPNPTTGRTAARGLALGEVDTTVDAGVHSPVAGAATPSTTPTTGVTGSAPAPADRAKVEVTRSGPAKAKAGQKIAYEITVRVSNASSTPAFAVILRDLLPKGVVVSSANGHDLPKVRGAALTWSLGDLAPGSTRTVRYIVQVDRRTVGTIRSHATARARNAAEVSATIKTRIVPAGRHSFSIQT